MAGVGRAADAQAVGRHVSMTLSQWGELVLLAAALLVPPVLAYAFRNKFLAFAVGVIWVWGMMVACGQWLLATDPQYDSIGPMMAIFFGWKIGLIYCGPWLLGALAVKAVRARRNRRRDEASSADASAPPNPASSGSGSSP